MSDILEPTPEGLLEVVFLGACTLSGGKPGNLWILSETLDKVDPNDSVDPVEIVRRVASAYGKKSTGGRVIGGLYRVKGETEGERVTRMSFGTLQFIGRSTNPLVAAFEASDSQARDDERRARAERAAKSDPTIMRDMQRTVEVLRKLPVRHALAVCDAIRAELARQVLAR
jgi:hypothetical protein